MPSFAIVVDGQEIPPGLHILSITVTKMVNRISSAKITLLDGDPAQEDFPASNTDLFVPGKRIEIRAGYHSSNAAIFAGIIIKHGLRVRNGKPSLLQIECRHEAVRMTGERKTACFRDSLDSDAFDTIMGRYGLDKEIEASSVQHEELVQFCSTDWDFIVTRAEVNGMFVFTNDGSVAIKKPDFSGDPVISLLYGATILEFDAEMDARTQIPSATAKAWDISGQELRSSENSDIPVTAPGNIGSEDLADVMGMETMTLRHTGLRPGQELRAWADAQTLRSRLTKAQGRVRFTGFSGVNPGDMIELGGVGNRFNGRALVTGVRHELGSGLWTTDAQFGLSPRWFIEENSVSQPPASGLLPSVSGLQIGVVLQLQDDPAGEERVLVQMPLVSEEGIWARVATVDAGAGRGSFFRPEIGDEVLLGFLNDDPRDGVVLGMFNSSAKPAPFQAKDGNPEKGFVTRSGLRLVFNDEKKIITLETPGGRVVTLDDDSGTVAIEDGDGNRISMTSEGISLESPGTISLKADGDISIEGMNTSLKAGAQFKAEGSGGVEMSSSATATIKGSLVQIN
jgi:Rhs element Vgr protein